MGRGPAACSRAGVRGARRRIYHGTDRDDSRHLTGRAFSLPEVRDVTRAAGQFLEGPRPDGPFRVYHASFERFLTDPKQNPNWPIDRADTHAAVLQALRAEGGDRGWLASSAYARRYAHEHAAAAPAR